MRNRHNWESSLLAITGLIAPTLSATVQNKPVTIPVTASNEQPHDEGSV